MNTAQARNAYRQSESQAQINPVKLIHMMYDRLLIHLNDAMVGIAEENLIKRGENLGKAIALLSELNASISEEDTTEAATFLRGLYGAILTELPKVSVSNDGQVLKQSIQYVEKLKEIWEQTAMRELDDQQLARVEKLEPKKMMRSYDEGRDLAMQGLSVSI